MGLGDERIVNPEAVSQALRCVICTEVFIDPVCGRTCQHAFCRDCISKALDRRQSCPTCRAALPRKSLQPHLVIREFLDELQVKCEAGCGWAGRQDAHAAHAAACPAKLLGAARAQLTVQVRQLGEASVQLHEREVRIREQDGQLSEAREQLKKQEVRLGVQSRQLQGCRDEALELDRLRACLPQRDARIEELEAELARARRMASMASAAKRKFAILQAEAADKLAKVAQEARIAADNAARDAESAQMAVPMQIFVKTDGRRTITVDAERHHTIACIKSMVEKKCGVPPAAFYLTRGGLLEDSQSIGALGIEKETTLIMSVRVSACLR